MANNELGERFRIPAVAILVSLALMLTACEGQPLVFSPSKLPDATVGQPYQASITIIGNKTPVGNIETNNTTGLPSGLKITYTKFENTASISGTPQVAGTFDFIVRAQCMGTNQPGQAGDMPYSLIVKSP